MAVCLVDSCISVLGFVLDKTGTATLVNNLRQVVRDFGKGIEEALAQTLGFVDRDA